MTATSIGTITGSATYNACCSLRRRRYLAIQYSRRGPRNARVASAAPAASTPATGPQSKELPPSRRKRGKRGGPRPDRIRRNAGQQRWRAGIRRYPHRADGRSRHRRPGDAGRNGRIAPKRRTARSRGRRQVRAVRHGSARAPRRHLRADAALPQPDGRRPESKQSVAVAMAPKEPTRRSSR